MVAWYCFGYGTFELGFFIVGGNMYLLGKKSENSSTLLLRIKMLSEYLLADIPEPQSRLNVNEVDDLYEQYKLDAVYVLREGTLIGTFEGNPAVVYETGDIVGLSQCYQLPSPALSSDTPVILDRYEATQFLRFVTESKDKNAVWASYLITLNTAILNAYGELVRARTQPHTGFISYNKGDVIIEAGTDAKDVYTVISGSAEAFVDGVKVGDILQDEIFGAMAVFTNSQRSATVIAAEQCTILAVPRDEFISVINTHPETTLVLIENMARCINDLNARVSDADMTAPII